MVKHAFASRWLSFCSGRGHGYEAGGSRTGGGRSRLSYCRSEPKNRTVLNLGPTCRNSHLYTYYVYVVSVCLCVDLREEERERERDRETERQRDRETERQRDRETEREREGKKERKREKARERARDRSLALNPNESTS